MELWLLPHGHFSKISSCSSSCTNMLDALFVPSIVQALHLVNQKACWKWINSPPPPIAINPACSKCLQALEKIIRLIWHLIKLLILNVKTMFETATS